MKAYTDDLQKRGIQYYSILTGITPAYAEIDSDIDDMVVIHLYDVIELDGTGLSFTYDWYTVNRYTAKGYELNENEIDLTDSSIAVLNEEFSAKKAFSQELDNH
jgi:hypothetical protein